MYGPPGPPSPFSTDFTFLKEGQSIEDVIKEQLGGKSYLKMNEEGSVHLIPGENPEFGTLYGTNMFALGTGKKRFMIDACGGNQSSFLENVKKFCVDQNCYFEMIFVTHGHFDHFEGAQDIIDLMRQMGFPAPKICKNVDGNQFEQNRLETYPELKNHLIHIKEGDIFTLKGQNSQI